MTTHCVLTLMTVAAVGAFVMFAGPVAADTDEPAEPSTAVLETELARMSYAIGMQLGQSLQQSDLELDSVALFAAIDDALNGRQPALTEDEEKAAMEALQQRMMAEMMSQAEKNLEEAQEFLMQNAAEPGVVQLDSGLQYQVVEAGEGDKPAADSQVRVHYRGTLLDGEEFDSSYARGEPAVFQVNQVIPGWQEALQLMSVGAEYKLVIPPDLAYGPQGNQRIPGNSVLLFDVELIEIIE